MDAVILIFPAIAALSSALCYVLAQRKNRNIYTWMLLGLIFGPLALIALALLGPQGSKNP